MNRIVILTGSSLCHNPRVFKEATALAKAGYEVKVLGGWLVPELKARDQDMMGRLAFEFIPVIDLTLQTSKAILLNLVRRARRRVGNLIHTGLGLENASQLGYCVSALRRAAMQCQADLFIAHSESALYVASELLQEGRCVGVDMEDWFSEDLTPYARIHRPIKLLRALEAKILREATHSTCTSSVMSVALASAYDCTPPIPLYNAFAWGERERLDGLRRDRKDHRKVSIHWFSQTIGFDRGLEELFSALPLLKHDVEIHLRGKAVSGFHEWLDRNVSESWRRRIFLHPLVPNDELLSRIAEHDIGFAGELKFCRSRDLTVTNKILQFMLGGLAVVASDTAGQREIAEKANIAVRIYRSGDSVSLANELNGLLSNRETLNASRRAALHAAEETFCWERVAPSLVRSVEKACEASGLLNRRRNHVAD